jgi:hypothetical protein
MLERGNRDGNLSGIASRNAIVGLQVVQIESRIRSNGHVESSGVFVAEHRPLASYYQTILPALVLGCLAP